MEIKNMSINQNCDAWKSEYASQSKLASSIDMNTSLLWSQ